MLSCAPRARRWLTIAERHHAEYRESVGDAEPFAQDIRHAALEKPAGVAFRDPIMALPAGLYPVLQDDQHVTDGETSIVLAVLERLAALDHRLKRLGLALQDVDHVMT